MEFIELPAYTEAIDDLLSGDEQHALQISLINRPESGPIISGSGGLRKMRWRVRGSGKRGGLRIIYYLHTGHTFYMLFAYRKSRQDDLTPRQLRLLKKLMEGIGDER